MAVAAPANVSSLLSSLLMFEGQTKTTTRIRAGTETAHFAFELCVCVCVCQTGTESQLQRYYSVKYEQANSSGRQYESVAADRVIEQVRRNCERRRRRPLFVRSFRVRVSEHDFSYGDVKCAVCGVLCGAVRFFSRSTV